VRRGSIGSRRTVDYDWRVAENSKGTAVKSGLGVVGALATIVSVWWFALRPRLKRREK